MSACLFLTRQLKTGVTLLTVGAGSCQCDFRFSVFSSFSLVSVFLFLVFFY